MFLADQITLDSRTVRETRDGYLVAEARVARTGIQTYTAGELGLTDRAASDVIRVYRSPEEVFAKDSMESFTWRPMTNDHPSAMVTADSWKSVAVGMTGDRAKREIADDGEYLVVPLTMMDAEAIRDYRSGKRQLSNGYGCELIMGDGVVPASDKFHAGQSFNARQADIRGNHTAMCDAARGGSKLVFGDALPVEAARTLFQSMLDSQGDNAVSNLKTITFDGLPVADVSPAAEAVITKLQGQVADAVKAKDASETKVGELTAAVSTKDGEILALTAKLKDAEVTPEKMQTLVDARAKVIGLAKAVAGADLVTDGKTDAEIRKAAVVAKIGDAATALDDNAIMGAFVALTKDVKVDATDDLSRVIGDNVSRPVGDAQTRADDAWKRQGEDMNAWRNPKAA